MFGIIDCIIAQKHPTSKQGIKTINTEYIQTILLSQLSFAQFRPYATSFQGLLLSLTLMPKLKRPWRWVWTLYFCSRPPLTHGLMILLRMWIICKISTVILLKRNMTKKDVCWTQMFHSLSCNFSFCTDFLHQWWLLKVKINKALSKQSKQFLLLFYFLV